MTLVSLLERFGGYTLSTLLEEDARIFQLVRWVDREREMNGGEQE